MDVLLIVYMICIYLLYIIHIIINVKLCKSCARQHQNDVHVVGVELPLTGYVGV